MIRIDNLRFSYGQQPFLQGLSAYWPKGQVMGLLGPNGSGKTTLLHLLAGDLRPQSGTIRLKEKPLPAYSSSELARERAVLKQHNTLAMDFRVEEVVLMGRYPHFRNLPAAQDWEYLREALAMTGLSRFWGRSYRQLSGGEKQRVELARVMLQLWEAWKSPQSEKLLLLDEPLNNLDVEHQHRILQLTRDFAARGNAVVLVLHDLNLAARFCDDLLLLSNGREMAQGSPWEVLTEARISEAFHFPAKVQPHPFLGCPSIYFGDFANTSSKTPHPNQSSDRAEAAKPAAPNSSVPH